ncbi:MAG: Cna B-type domain-containing protein [Oscillospiraceae bacterium]|nr:Cna B-type domain-containing protein [Oscillospiraceae bacterium]
MEGPDAPEASFTFALEQAANAAGGAFDGTPITRTKTVSTTGAGNYPFSFDEITGLTAGTYWFTVREAAGSAGSGWSGDTATRIVKVDVSGDPLTATATYETGTSIFTNTYSGTPGGENIILTGEKLWVHGFNPVAARPSKITVYVKNGDFVAWQKAVSEADGWRWSVSLPKFDAAGKEILYTVDEAELPGYTKTVTGSLSAGFVITNTYEGAAEDQTVLISGKKTWIHGSNAESKRPKQITVLIRNGSYVAEQRVVTEADNWQWSFELPRYDSAGKEIRYTIDENAVPGYAKTVSGYDISNRFISGDYPGDGPKTGDSGNFSLWIVLMAASLAALVCVYRYSRKRRPH